MNEYQLTRIEDPDVVDGDEIAGAESVTWTWGGNPRKQWTRWQILSTAISIALCFYCRWIDVVLLLFIGRCTIHTTT